jgi:hypothetical protein
MVRNWNFECNSIYPNFIMNSEWTQEECTIKKLEKKIQIYYYLNK